MMPTGPFLPSIQMMELFFHQSGQPVSERLKRVLELQFYRSAETAVLDDPREAREVERLCRENGLRHVCWATPFLNAEQLNLSSLDQTLRTRSVARLKELLEIAAQSGADGFSFLSGPAPETPAQVPEAIKRFTESMLEIASAAARYPHMNLLLEPLDREAHKRNTVGMTSEASGIIRQARQVFPGAGLVWDSAHASLNGEPLEESLAQAGDTVKQVHLCNAVLQPDAPGYGDYHMLPGAPGYLTEQRGAQILSAAAIPAAGLPVAVEMRPPAGMDPWEAEQTARRFLQAAFDLSGKP